MILLKDLHYDENKAEMIINIKDKQFDGEIHKAIISVNFKFGIKCLIKEFDQNINQEILWTEHDINRLLEQVNEIYNNNFNNKKDYMGITLFEQEFEAICFFVSDTIILIFISVGVSSMGPAIKLTVTKDDLLKWANQIKQHFYS